jgi:sulfatase maturation enzyme AslB (radical SAM superfamily)
MTVGVITNGTLITERIMRLFETLPVSILLSLDGTPNRHNAMRGGFDRIEKWFPRLIDLGRVSVAMQAGVVNDLYENISFIWSTGLTRVYINIIETYGWYSANDVAEFEQQYDNILTAMLRGKGEVSCALQLYETLRQPTHHQGCGITAKGLACDWHGLLYPCHRAMEIGTQLSIGDIYKGIDDGLSTKIRRMIHESSYQSLSAKQFPLVSFCPIAIYQKHHDFAESWNQYYCEMINAKAKLVSKHYHEISAYQTRKQNMADSLSTRQHELVT